MRRPPSPTLFPSTPLFLRGGLGQLRRRVSAPGLVVSVGPDPAGGETTELITADWSAANTTFDRFMRRY